MVAFGAVGGNRLVDAVALGAGVLDLVGGLSGVDGPVHAEDVRGAHGCAQDARDLVAVVELAGRKARGAGGTEQQVVDRLDGIGGAKRQLLIGEGLLGGVGVAGDVLGGAGAATGVGHIVGVADAGIGGTGHAVDVRIHVGHIVEHGGIGPGAVVAEDGDGVLDVQLLAVAGGGAAFHEGVAFQIAAGGIDGVKSAHVAGNRDGDLDGLGGAGGDGDGGRGGAVHGIGHGPVKVRGGLGHQGVVAAVVNVLGEEVGAQGVGLSLGGHVVDLEGVAPGALLGGQIAELSLDLAVGIGGGGVGAHEDHRGSVDRIVDVGKASADLDGGIVGSGLGADVHGHGGGHQKALGDLTGGVAGEGHVILTQVLAEGGGQTGDVGGGHGGAGHQLILVGAADVSAGGLVGAPEGVDVAAGSGDLGLHEQRAGNAPGGEDAHFRIVRDLHMRDFGADAHGAGIVGDGAGGVGGGVRLDRVGVGQGDGDHREGAGVVVEGHVDGAGRIVGDDQGLGVVGFQVIALLIEGDVAAVADNDLAGEADRAVDRGIVAGVARRVHVDVAVAAADGGHLGAGGVGLIIEDLLAAVEGQRAAGDAGIFGGGDAEAVGVGAGAAAGVHVGVLNVELAVIQPVGEIVGVAGGDGHHSLGVGAGVGDLVHRGLIAGGVGEALAGGAQRQVHRVAAQNDGVLDGDHVVGIVSAAAGAEDLHDEKLGVRGHADDVDAVRSFHVGAAALDVAVGRGDAGHVRAVLALGVAQVVDGGVLIHVVVAEGDLGGDVGRAGAVELALDGAQVGGGEEADVLAGLLNGIVEGVGIHGLVGGVQTGVDDGDAGARAGVALGPGVSSADHEGGGVGGVRPIAFLAFHGRGGIVTVFQEDVLDAGDGLDLRNVAVADVRRDRVHRQGDVPLDVQLGADGSLDLIGQGGLAAAEALAVGNRGGILRDVVHAVACVKGGGLVELDRHTDDIAQRVFFLFDQPSVGKRRFRGLLGQGVRKCGNRDGQNHRQRQQQAEQPSNGAGCCHSNRSL